MLTTFAARQQEAARSQQPGEFVQASRQQEGHRSTVVRGQTQASWDHFEYSQAQHIVVVLMSYVEGRCTQILRTVLSGSRTTHAEATGPHSVVQAG